MVGWTNRRLRRWVAVGGVLASCAMVVGDAAGPPAEPATGAVRADPVRDHPVRVLQMNLCNSGVAGCYTGRSVGEAAAVIRAEMPDAVTLNEVCRDDVAALERTLADADPGGRVVSAFQAVGDRRTGGAFRCRNGQPYGIGLVARLGSGSAGSEAVGAQYAVQDTDNQEERAWLCLSPTTPAATAVAVCTTHLANTSAAVARAQCAYLLGTAVRAVRARNGWVPLVLGGDLNLGSDVRACVPAGDRRADDGVVQHVVATPEFVVGSHRTIDLPATDHPGLLVTLTRQGRPNVGELGSVARQ